MKPQVYLIPTVLDEDADALSALPLTLKTVVAGCNVFFVENERTARRFFKQIWKEMVIDDYQWHTIHKAEKEVLEKFRRHLAKGDVVGIVSEAGCPAVADPGQMLVREAQRLKAVVKPLVGPNSILLALMASGMNGQQFSFHGYLPVDRVERKKMLKQLEMESAKTSATQIFIETPYRNNQLIDDAIASLQPTTLFCIAASLTSAKENIRTKTIAEWRQKKPDIHKLPAIFLLQAAQP